MTAPEDPRRNEGTRRSGGDGSSPDAGPAPINREPIAAWTRDAMQAMGFQGFQPFSALSAAVVPPGPGVYCVVRTITTGEPTFLPRSPAGHFKGKDPTAPVAELKQLWVTGSEVIYIGKAQAGARRDRGLWSRLKEYRDFGAGRPAPHSGGRRIWQLADRAELLVGWMVTTDIQAPLIERRLLDEFKRDHSGRLPYANMR